MARRKHYNRYDDDFKATADTPGVLAKHVTDALDIHDVMLYRWRMEMRRGQIMAKKKNINIDSEVKSELKRLRKLEQEYNLLQEGHALLKKTTRFSLLQKRKSSSS
ncbi:transposase [Microbulbifer sp. TRSA005]|uniref:transposase n=1 Tax=Microbulbifer sp. TRSA005 TaxID=3243383 RepID=UPI004039A96F